LILLGIHAGESPLSLFPKFCSLAFWPCPSWPRLNFIVEIDDKDLPREQFDDSTPLRIKGEVDRRWNQRQRYIDVKSVQIVR